MLCRFCAGKEIVIGEGTILGSGAMVIDNDFHRTQGEWEWTGDCTGGARPRAYWPGLLYRRPRDRAKGRAPWVIARWSVLEPW